MSLNWSVEKVDDYQALQADDWEHAVTEALIWATVAVGLPGITEANAGDFYARLRVVEQAGTFMYRDGKPYRLTPQDVLRRVGLSTNVSPEPEAKWMKRWIGGELNDGRRDFIVARDRQRALEEVS